MRSRKPIVEVGSAGAASQRSRVTILRVPWGLAVSLLLLLGVAGMMLLPKEDQSAVLHWGSPAFLVAEAIGKKRGTYELDNSVTADIAALGSSTGRPAKVTHSKKSHQSCPAGDRRGVFYKEFSHDDFFRHLSTAPEFKALAPEVLSSDPWILQFDAFLSREESQIVLQECDVFHPDHLATGAENLRYRNSSSFSCRKGNPCTEKPGFSAYRQRMADVLGVGLEHSEGINVLKYGEGGFYGKHHDYVAINQNPDHETCGPRVLTFMSYLNDVEEGGETSFFHLGVKVQPKAGRAILWSDTFSRDPLAKDERTAHEALRVVRGEKYTATTWFQQFDRDSNVDALCCAACVGCPRPNRWQKRLMELAMAREEDTTVTTTVRTDHNDAMTKQPIPPPLPRRSFFKSLFWGSCPVGDRSGMFSKNGAQSQSLLFERLLSGESYKKYSPVLLSRDPWILQLDSFLDAGECNALVEDCDQFRPDIVTNSGLVNNYRNSSSYNCGLDQQCWQKQSFQHYADKVSSLLDVDWRHSEGVSVLKYHEGGFYRRHHDFIAIEQNPNHPNCGPRVLTFMTYLSDVERGGATAFFHLGINVRPKVGRALLWADTFADDPLAKDERTAHEALDVEKGVKVTATSWFVQYDRAANMHAECCALRYP